MHRHYALWTGLAGSIALGIPTLALAAAGSPPENEVATTLVETVRQATARFKDVAEAEKAGYGGFHGCVSGPQEGSMGTHLVNGALVVDGELDATRPEALMYEVRGGIPHLTGVEYVVFADAWDANHDAPPTLLGQVFHYVGAPNRYRIPAFYELHVWAWKRNPNGMFADWNPRVSCEEYVGTGEVHAGH